MSHPSAGQARLEARERRNLIHWSIHPRDIPPMDSEQHTHAPSPRASPKHASAFNSNSDSSDQELPSSPRLHRALSHEDRIHQTSSPKSTSPQAASGRKRRQRKSNRSQTPTNNASANTKGQVARRAHSHEVLNDEISDDNTVINPSGIQSTPASPITTSASAQRSSEATKHGSTRDSTDVSDYHPDSDLLASSMGYV